MRQQHCDFGEEWIGQNGCDFFVASAPGVPDQLAKVNLKGRGQALKGAKGRNCLPVFNLGDVGPGHLHAPRQLTLAQVARLADFSHLPGHLEPGFCRSWSRGQAGHQLWGEEHRLLDIQGSVAFSAKGVDGPELNQQTIVAPHNFTCFHAH
jgi:hypothetical protein